MMDRADPSLPDPPLRPLADLLAARSRARKAFLDVLARVEAAARTPEGVTPALESTCALARAAWRKAEAELEEHHRRARA